jgi:hypothetical protein
MNTFVKNNSLLIGSQKNQPDFPHDPNNVVLVFDTSMQTENLTISVPIQGATPNCTINWGDGSSESHTTTGNKTHTYSSAGIYVVQISGTLRTLSFNAVDITKRKLVRCLSF